MPDEVTTPTGAPADASATTATTAPVTTTQDEPVLNKRELVDARKEIREANKSIKDAVAQFTALAQQIQKPAEKKEEKPATADDALAELRELKGMLAFKDALDERGVTDTKQRRVLERLFRAERPSDARQWLDSEMEGIGTIAKPAASASTGTETKKDPAIAPSNTGAPAVGGNGAAVPLDPSLVPQSVVDAWTPEEARAWYEKYKAQNGVFKHPFADKKRERADGTMAVAQTIAKALRQIK